MDRVAVVVGNQVITESEVFQEVRLTAFLNRQPLDLSAAARREAAERLVDQQLIRNEMQIGGYRRRRKRRATRSCASSARRTTPVSRHFTPRSTKYGLTEDEVKRHLLWQVAALRFTDQRFRLATAAPPAQSADR